MAATVMVPLDGSPAAETALPWAVVLAQKANATLRLVEVHAPPAVFLDGETIASTVVPDEAIRERESDYLAKVQTRLKPASVALTAELLDGSVIQSLAEYARRLQPTWIVMLSHGRGAVARFFLGETAHEFVRESPSPVLLVHSTEPKPDILAVPQAQRVLIPLDGSELAERMLVPATELAKTLGAEVTVLMALAAVPDIEAIARRHEPGMPGPWDPAAAPAKAQLYLEHKVDRIRAQSLRANCKVVANGGAAEVIVAEADQVPGTVVALATHGRGGLSKVVFGSIADAVVRKSKCPVLVYRPSS